jgi:hypothetical protein
MIVSVATLLRRSLSAAERDRERSRRLFIVNDRSQECVFLRFAGCKKHATGWSNHFDSTLPVSLVAKLTVTLVITGAVTLTCNDNVLFALKVEAITEFTDCWGTRRE